jgi:KUP system potassium uptake protein
LAVAGLVHLVHYPRVLLALSPNYALAYAGHVGAGTTFAVLGSVFLALTGGEALYADMGHFGRSAIRVSWFAFVLPALVLVYLGQGALVLSNPASADNPFFILFPDWLLIPALLHSVKRSHHDSSTGASSANLGDKGQCRVQSLYRKSLLGF